MHAFSGPRVLNLGQNHQAELSSWEGVASDIFSQSLIECNHSVRGGKKTSPNHLPFVSLEVVWWLDKNSKIQ